MDDFNSSSGSNSGRNDFNPSGSDNTPEGSRNINYNTNYNTNYNNGKKNKSGCLIAFAIAAGVVIAAIVVIAIIFTSLFALASGAASGISGMVMADDYYAEGDYVETLYFEGTISSDSAYTSGYDHEGTLNEIDYLIDDDYNTGLLLYLNSPGGGTYESDEMYQKIMKYKEETGRPVYAYMGKQATSGALYISMAADEIYAGRMTLTGSIGVIMENYDLSGLMEKLGIKENNVKSGANKDMFGISGYTDEQKQILQSIIDENYEIFANVVADSRGIPVDEVKTFADGRVFSAYQALDLGLIDHVMTYDEFMDEMSGKFSGSEFIDFRSSSMSVIDMLLSKTGGVIQNSSDNALYDIFSRKNQSPFNYIYEN